MQPSAVAVAAASI